jgi:hypothetical protein
MSEAPVLPMSDAPLDLSWMSRHGEWGMRAKPGKQGLTLADIQIGSYGEPAAHSDNQTGRPRGAASRPSSYRIGGYSVVNKSEIWLENASFLYEEALQRQWSSATDVPWHTIKPLPDDIEQAQCQLATFLTEVEFVAGDVPARWISQTTPDFFEPRQCLLAQVMDESRHMDVFRKRALANGGGLMLTSGGTAGVVGSIDLARLHRDVVAVAHLRRRRGADDVPHGRTDGVQRGGKGDVPAVRAGRSAPRGVRCHAHALHVRDGAGAP